LQKYATGPPHPINLSKLTGARKDAKVAISAKNTKTEITKVKANVTV
jgi:hypothetical protein